jgi:hypothetical protein
MVIRISEQEFVAQRAGGLTWDGPEWPAWVTLHPQDDERSAPASWRTDVPVTLGVSLFIDAIVSHMVRRGEYAYGTVYARRLDGAGRAAGDWHYDLGEYTPEGATRFVSTWRSDDFPIGNVFSLPHGETLQAPNRRVTSFHEGSDFHQHPEVPAVPYAWGVFLSATLYREGEPANLDCPRLAALRDRGPYAELARAHRPVVRSSYGGA